MSEMLYVPSDMDVHVIELEIYSPDAKNSTRSPGTDVAYALPAQLQRVNNTQTAFDNWYNAMSSSPALHQVRQNGTITGSTAPYKMQPPATSSTGVRFYIGNASKWTQGTFIFSHYHGHDLPENAQFAYKLLADYWVRLAQRSGHFGERSIITIADRDAHQSRHNDHRYTNLSQHFIIKFNEINTYDRIETLCDFTKRLLYALRNNAICDKEVTKAAEQIVTKLASHFIDNPPRELCGKQLESLVTKHLDWEA